MQHKGLLNAVAIFSQPHNNNNNRKQQQKQVDGIFSLEARL